MVCISAKPQDPPLRPRRKREKKKIAFASIQMPTALAQLRALVAACTMTANVEGKDASGA
jgi:hypothetical protein